MIIVDKELSLQETFLNTNNPHSYKALLVLIQY